MDEYPFQIWYDNLTPYDPPYYPCAGGGKPIDEELDPEDEPDGF